MNKYSTYPVGHPKIITEGFTDVDNYFGLIRCRVIPPRGLYLPVLPVRCLKKLMFPLCKICADSMQTTPCQHTPDERAFVGTWVTEEVKMAKKKGYQITHVRTFPQVFSSFLVRIFFLIVLYFIDLRGLPL